MTIIEPLVIKNIHEGRVAEGGVLVLIQSDGTFLRRKWVQETTVENTLHLGNTIETAPQEFTAMEITIGHDGFIKVYSREMAISYPNGMNIGTDEGTVIEYTTAETGAL